MLLRSLIGGTAAVLLCSAMAGAQALSERPAWLVDPAGIGAATPQMMLVDDSSQVQPKKKTPLEVNPERDHKRWLGFAGEPVKIGQYWVGLECRRVGEALGMQLGLAEGEGLLVINVLPDSPAAKATVQRNDVLIAAAGKPLKGLQDLIDAVETAKEKELPIELFRSGKKQQLSITPVKRPEEDRYARDLTAPRAGADWDRVRRWFERARPGGRWKPQKDEEGELPWRFQFFGPGAILPPGAAVNPPLPANLSVSITKNGAEPAKIVVKRDNESWELTENDLDELPDDVRPHVERMLGPIGQRGLHHRNMFNFKLEPHWPGTPEIDVQLGPLDPRGLMKEQIDQMNQRIEQLRKSIDELHKSGPAQKEAPAKDDNRA